jgi:hypothetical protein
VTRPLLRAAAARTPGLAPSLYVRGLARLCSRAAAGGGADIAALQGFEPPIAANYARFGLKP